MSSQSFLAASTIVSLRPLFFVLRLLQPVTLGTVADTSECTFDVTTTDLTGCDHQNSVCPPTEGDMGSYMTAMRAFAECAARNEEAPGYCHGALADAKILANQQFCTGGVTTNIGCERRHVVSCPLACS